MNSIHWNQFLLRFLTAFAVFEGVGFPLRMLFFSKFYQDTGMEIFLSPVSVVYWPLPLVADFFLVMGLGFLIQSSDRLSSLGLLGGILTSIFFSLGAFGSTSLFLIAFTTIPNNIIFAWASSQVILTMVTSLFFTVQVSDG